MEAYIITISDNPMSVASANRCIESSNIPIETFKAITPDNVSQYFNDNNLKWTYPWSGMVHDFKSGLKLSSYQTAVPEKRMACFASHYDLWRKCHSSGSPILILEHDSIFIKKINYQYLLDSKYGIISINDPRGATRKSSQYHDSIQSCKEDVAPAANIDDFMVPQGLPGNSAYIIKPALAAKLIETVHEYGAWPNDAIMCKQLIPRLGCSKTYYTRVQGVASTTTL